jgi:hypothetical protein
MNWWRILIVAFWTFVGVMLAWQAYDYNNHVVIESETHPEKHYFYNPNPGSVVPPKAPSPDVHQVAYHVIPGSPEPGSFTVQFTVKNMGDIAATAIQVKVRPYRGILNSDPDSGGSHLTNGNIGPISDDDPVSQFGQWVAVPDLAPGQLSSNSVVFADEPGKTPNDNSRLEIVFDPVKSK